MGGWSRILAGLVAIGWVNSPARAQNDEDVVIMRQFTVEAGQPWSYVEIPGYEVLSRCGRTVTRWFADGLAYSAPLEEELVPDGWVAPLSEPITALLFNHGPEEPSRGPLVPAPVHPDRTDPRYWGRLPPPDVITGETFAHDSGSFGLCANLWGIRNWVARYSTVVVDPPELWRFRLRAHRPAPPAWFIEGIVGPYGLRDCRADAGSLVLPGANWISEEETEAYLAAAARAGPERAAPPGVVVMEPFVVTARGSSARRIALLPLRELFRPREPGEELTHLWLCEAALFVRWGLFAVDDEAPNHRAAFEEFLRQASNGPPREEQFLRTFGFGYSEMEEKLARYLEAARTEILTVPYRHLRRWPPSRPVFRMRPAKEAEVARIIGNWERMKGDALRLTRPELSRQYLALAGKTLRAAFDEGIRDPRLLAVLRVYEQDMGENRK